jgi:hypothetical protein
MPWGTSLINCHDVVNKYDAIKTADVYILKHNEGRVIYTLLYSSLYVCIKK